MCVWAGGAMAQPRTGGLGAASDAAQRVFNGTSQGTQEHVPKEERATQRQIFPGGKEALLQYLEQNIHYPEAAAAEGVQGRVYIRFVILADGVVDSVAVQRGIHPLLDAEAIRVVENMPRWQPALQNGKPVAARQLLPVTFTHAGN